MSSDEGHFLPPEWKVPIVEAVQHNREMMLKLAASLPAPPPLTRRQKLARRVRDARERLALRLAPWLKGGWDE